MFSSSIKEKNHEGQQIYIIHYLKGEKMAYSIGVINDIDGNNIQYFCTNGKGSSRGAILYLINFNVVCIHNKVVEKI